MRQTWDPIGYGRNAGFVPALGLPVAEWLEPRPGERVRDLGCGDGALTEKLTQLGCIVVGIDTSPEFVAAAKGRGPDARLMDGERLAFDSELDAVFSNAEGSWHADYVRLRFAAVRR